MELSWIEWHAMPIITRAKTVKLQCRDQILGLYVRDITQACFSQTSVMFLFGFRLEKQTVPRKADVDGCHKASCILLSAGCSCI